MLLRNIPHYSAATADILLARIAEHVFGTAKVRKNFKKIVFFKNNLFQKTRAAYLLPLSFDCIYDAIVYFTLLIFSTLSSLPFLSLRLSRYIPDDNSLVLKWSSVAAACICNMRPVISIRLALTIIGLLI